MFCVLMLVILAVAGIFSAANRSLARQALDCVLRRVTLRPCITGFDEKMKARILGSVLLRSETAARLLNRNFELLSWMALLLLTFASLWGARGMYLFYTTGSCSGLNVDSFCLFDPKGASNQVSLSGSCPVRPKGGGAPSLSGVELGGFPTLKGKGEGKIVMIGCYGCSYSRQVYPMVRELARNTGASLVFIDYPVKVTSDLMARVGYCVYRRDPAGYWRLNDRLFAADPARLDDPLFARQAVSELGAGESEVEGCTAAPGTEAAVSALLDRAGRTGFFGTPTVFVNGKALIGPKPYRVYAIALRGPLYFLK